MAKKKNYTKQQVAIIKAKYAKKKAISKKRKKDKVLYPHFRYYNKTRHPALITAEVRINNNRNDDEFKFKRVSSGVNYFGDDYVEVTNNPDPSKKKPMYICTKVEQDKQSEFGRPKKWKVPHYIK